MIMMEDTQEEVVHQEPILTPSNQQETLESAARSTLSRAVNFSTNTAHSDGHWCGELRSNSTVTSEYVFLYQALSLDLNPFKDALCHWYLSEQKKDGSWGIAPNYPGDVSTTTEAYLALKILGLAPDHPAMHRAQEFVILHGGLAKVRIFTRIYLATFGLFRWDAVPEMPAELILMPSKAPINIYKISSWARSTIVPLLIICHHRPIFSLPNGKAAPNDFLDELWYLHPGYGDISYAPPLWDIWNSDLVSLGFAAVDKVLYFLGGLRSFPTRSYCRRKCVDWILEHQEPAGDWAGIFPPMHVGILALVLEGFTITDSPVRKGLEAIERFAWQDESGKRMQACVSPVWDTCLTTIGLCDAGLPGSHSNITAATSWLRSHQILGPEGDWRVFSPGKVSGGFCFEYYNDWYPDVDDTAAVILSFLKADPQSASSLHVLRACEWVLGMQNRDGGWAAFDIDNDKLFMNKIPFSDMDSLCDPSTADVTGRVIEAFGLLNQVSEKTRVSPLFLGRIRGACDRAIRYLAADQERNGSWYGRWGVNYVYGTSNVLTGLEYFSSDPRVAPLRRSGLQWLRSVQNTDGGWGECLETYGNPARAGCGVSTASQTAWGLMGMLAGKGLYSGYNSGETVEKGIRWLIDHQESEKTHLIDTPDQEAGTWPESQYTGTGFPGFFYLQYDLYRHYFPMMALGRYVAGSSMKG